MHVSRHTMIKCLAIFMDLIPSWWGGIKWVSVGSGAPSVDCLRSQYSRCMDIGSIHADRMFLRMTKLNTVRD